MQRSTTASSVTSVSRRDGGGGSSNTGGTVKAGSGEQGAGSSETERKGTTDGNSNSNANVSYSHFANSQIGGPAPRYSFETAGGTLSAEDTAAFDAAFEQWGADNYERAHALVGRNAKESSTSASGSAFYDPSLGWSFGDSTTTTVEASSRTNGQATIEDGAGPSPAPPQGGEGDGGNGPNGSSEARSTTETTTRQWSQYDGIGGDYDYEIYDSQRTYRVTDVLSGGEKRAELFMRETVLTRLLLPSRFRLGELPSVSQTI